MVLLTRRSLLVTGLAGSVVARFPARAQMAAFSHGMFTHAVASGDPMADRVILWTRFVTSDAQDGEIGWEVAEDESFGQIVASGRAPVIAANDFCVKVDAGGLRPGRPYAYRFVGADEPSVTGLTRTAPAGGVETMMFALFSCSNKGFGYFHAYRDAAARPEVELCIHVGDYLYEYHRGKYPDPDNMLDGRVIEPETEMLSQSDYFRRYASYRDDADLQELHRVKPWITVWDDHEIANDTWTDGAQNHNPETQGAFVARKERAVAAYLAWMPVRHDPAMGAKIYRRFDWGDLATIMMLDTRLIGRQKQLSYAPLMKAVGDKDEATFNAAVEAFARDQLNDPGRTLLGQAQEAWLSDELKRSKAAGATWQVLGQQVVMGRLSYPAALAPFLKDDADALAKAYVAAGARLGRLGMPNNLDAWGGYPAARERLLADLTAHANNTITLAGDSHNAWACNVGLRDGKPVAVEVGGTSVCSPGMESSLTKAGPGEREKALTEANPELSWSDATHRGYALVTLTRTRAETVFVATGDVREKGAALLGQTKLVSEASATGPSAWTMA